MKTEIKNSILFYFASFIISLLSVFLIWIQTSKYGINLSPDSTHYLRWSEAISQEGFAFIFNNKSATFPPFYPLLLSFTSAPFHLDSLIAARWFNIILAFFFSFFSLILCRKLTNNILILLISGLFIVASKPINNIFSYAWSEPLFLFLLLLVTFSIEKTDYKNLVLCGFLSALAILTRYAGVAIVPTVCLYIFMQKSELSEKIKKSFCYATIPTLTYIAYLIRNYYFTKTLMGSRATSTSGLISNFDRAFSTITLWFSGQYFFMTAFLLLILGAFIWNYKKDLVIHIINSQKIISFSACFSLVYSAFIIISSTTTAYDLINDRLMSPVFSSVFLMMLLLILFCIHIISSVKKDKILAYLMLSMFITCMIFSLVNTWKNDVFFRKNNGAGGYASTFWQENELVSYLKNQDIIQPADTVFSNEPFALFLVDRKISASRISNLRYSDFERSFLIFFNIPSSLPYSYTEHKKYCEIEKVTETQGGILYKVGKCKR